MAQRMLVIARTKPIEDCKRPIDGLSLFYTRMDPEYVRTQKIPKMGRNAVESCQVFIDGLKVPEEDRIGEEGKGFQYLLDGLNPERILVAAEAVGLGRVSLKRATEYAKERVIFDRPIGKNQGIQHPLAECWMYLEAADLMMLKAAALYDAGQPCGAEANSAKFLGAEAGYRACERAVMTHGGYGYAKEFDVERYLREVMIPRLAPVSRELVMCYIAERVLGLPKSY
jgi:acyl-CoA dehydrogenase